MNEFRRILLSRKMILTTLLAVFLCCIFFAYECNSEKEITLSGEALQSYIEGYPSFLTSVRENAKSVGMLAALSDNSGFTQNNIDKTLEDYAGLNHISLEAGENRGIVVFSDFIMADGIILAMVLVVLLMISKEKSKGLSLLVRCTHNGRARLSFQRSSIIAITATVVSLTVTTACMLTSSIVCGYTNLLRPIQSVPEFSLCSYPITILEYFILTALIKAFAATILGLIMQLALTLFEIIPGTIITCICAGIEFLLYMLINGTDRLAGFKLANIVALLRTDIFFKNYFNVNLFGQAIGFLPFALCALLLLGLFLPIASALISEKTGGFTLTLGLIDKIKKWLNLHAPNPPLLFWEIKKTFINQKGLLVLALIVYFAISSDVKYGYLNVESFHRDYYYNKYTGVITSDTLDEMQEEYDALYENLVNCEEEYKYLNRNNLNPDRQLSLMQEMSTIADMLSRLELITLEAEEAYTYTLETGIETQLVKPDAYELLLADDTSTTNKNSMLILITMIIIFSGSIACEKESNMETQLRTLKSGRKKLTFTKIVIVILTAPLLAISIHITQFLQIGKAVGYNNLDAAAQSISLLRHVPIQASIGETLIFIYAVRVIFTGIAGLAVMLISKFSRNRITVLCLCVVILLIPSVLSSAGISVIPDITKLIGFCFSG